MKTNTASLSSPAFVAAVLLLLVNDFILKPQFGNVLTGKLSDFAGLFAFPFFWAALLIRHRVAIYWSTAAAFILWKLPSSGPWIDAWNTVSPLQVSRVVDPTDLVALSILPLSYWFAGNFRPVSVRPLATLSIAVVSLFAFAATSRPYTVAFDQVYIFEGSEVAMMAKLREQGIETVEERSIFRSKWVLDIPDESCRGRLDATVTIRSKSARTEMRLRKMSHYCPSGPLSRAELLGVFKSKVAEPLGMRQR